MHSNEALRSIRKNNVLQAGVGLLLKQEIPLRGQRRLNVTHHTVTYYHTSRLTYPDQIGESYSKTIK